MVKKYIRIGIGILISLLAVSTYTLYNRNQGLKEEISVSMSNQKAFIAENPSLKEENRVFKFTVEQLNYYNDSILQNINESRGEYVIYAVMVFKVPDNIPSDEFQRNILNYYNTVGYKQSYGGGRNGF